MTLEEKIVQRDVSIIIVVGRRGESLKQKKCAIYFQIAHLIFKKFKELAYK